MKYGKAFNPFGQFLGLFIPNSIAMSDIPDTTKLLLGRLFQFAGKNGKAFPSRKTLALELNWNMRKLDRTIRILKDLQLIETYQENEQSPSIYIFLYNKLYEFKAAIKSDSGGADTSDSGGADTSDSGGADTDVKHKESIIKESINNIFSKEKSKKQNSCKSEEFVFNELYCPECLEKQFETPSGDTCKNGHGGCTGIEKPKKKRKRKKKILHTPSKPIQKTKQDRQYLNNPYGYSIETFEIIACWKKYGGKIHTNGNAIKGPKDIENNVAELLLQGRNPYISVCDDPEVNQKQWSIDEIKRCIKHYADDLKKPINKMYFQQFVLFRYTKRIKTKDYSPMAETFIDLPTEFATKRSQTLKERLHPLKSNEVISEKVWIRAANYLEEMDKVYEVTEQACWTHYFLNNLFIGYVEEFIKHDSRWLLSYIAGKAFLDEFIQKKVKSFMLKRRTLAN